MKKALKIFGYFLLGLLVIALGFAAYVQFSSLPVYPVNPPALKVTPDSALLAEGRRIVLTDCAHCHRGDNGKLNGALWASDPSMGTLWTANITRDSNAGIGAYTDGELAFLLRTGIKRNGHFAGPWMSFPLMSDQDVSAVIAFLHSDAPEIQPSAKQQPPADLKWLGKMLMKVIFKPSASYPTAPISTPSPDDKIAFGRYLATGRWECYRCHSASFETNNDLEPEKSAGYFGGGNPLEDKDHNIVPSANITPDPETGIGRWTEAQFAEAIRFGKRPDGQPLSHAMPPMTVLTDSEVSALWTYLQTVPPIHNAVQRRRPD
ncbi:MAG TPA: cytochrome c [Saprospiraceae bacterium]|nr:cytochrome c [Saprospiraceae bacterium]